MDFEKLFKCHYDMKTNAHRIIYEVFLYGIFSIQHQLTILMSICISISVTKAIPLKASNISEIKRSKNKRSEEKYKKLLTL